MEERRSGWRRIIKDDVGDAAHGTLDMRRAITVSCNAYFAQLGVFCVGAGPLRDTLHLLGFPDADPAELQAMLPFAAYGQGRSGDAAQNGTGQCSNCEWRRGADCTVDRRSERNAEPGACGHCAAGHCHFLADAMRSVVTDGTGRRAMKAARVSIAGKTGTAQLGEGSRILVRRIRSV